VNLELSMFKTTRTEGQESSEIRVNKSSAYNPLRTHKLKYPRLPHLSAMKPTAQVIIQAKT